METKRHLDRNHSDEPEFKTFKQQPGGSACLKPVLTLMEEPVDTVSPVYDSKFWGPYLSDRQWGTVREDNSVDGNCWEYFSHEDACSSVYRWGEDGLIGISDRESMFCACLGLWNGIDPILKERLFGLTGPQGNHGEDVKELYYYLDNTPDHTYMKALYRYPQTEFPYERLKKQNKEKDIVSDEEFEIIDTGVFDDDNCYWDITVEYAKDSAGSLLCRYSISNRSQTEAEIHVLPHFWFRNTWWSPDDKELLTNKPMLSKISNRGIKAEYQLGSFDIQFSVKDDGTCPDLLFTENEDDETNGLSTSCSTQHKDAFHKMIIHNLGISGRKQSGTKCAALYKLTVPPGGSQYIYWTLYPSTVKAKQDDLCHLVNEVIKSRKQEADQFYSKILQDIWSKEEKNVARQAYAGLLWNKQFYYYDVKTWRGIPMVDRGDNTSQTQDEEELEIVAEEQMFEGDICWNTPDNSREKEVISQQGQGHGIQHNPLEKEVTSKQVQGHDELIQHSLLEKEDTSKQVQGHDELIQHSLLETGDTSKQVQGHDELIQHNLLEKGDISKQVQGHDELIQHSLLEKGDISKQVQGHDELIQHSLLEKEVTSKQVQGHDELIQHSLLEKEDTSKQVQGHDELIQQSLLEKGDISKQVQGHDELIQHSLLEKEVTSKQVQGHDELIQHSLLEKEDTSKQVQGHDELIQHSLLEKGDTSKQVQGHDELIQHSLLEKEDISKQVQGHDELEQHSLLEKEDTSKQVQGHDSSEEVDMEDSELLNDNSSSDSEQDSELLDDNSSSDSEPDFPDIDVIPEEFVPERRNKQWEHMKNYDIISMPDKWEFPWYASWDTAFQMITFARIDPDFAKHQLLLFLSHRYMHINGQIPAFEFDFGAVNPPIHAWSCLKVFRITGSSDFNFLKKCFHGLLQNFSWWTNKQVLDNKYIYKGGFLGLDNISVLDRGAPLPHGITLEQVDATGWMALFSLNMFEICLELSRYETIYCDLCIKFLTHFIEVVKAMNKSIQDGGLWCVENGFYCDVLVDSTDSCRKAIQLKSLVGVIPVFACSVIHHDLADIYPELILQLNSQCDQNIGCIQKTPAGNYLLTAVPIDRLKMVFQILFKEEEFLSPYGIRSLSKTYELNPFHFKFGKKKVQVKYCPGESENRMFGGNSNWRGPVWLCMNFMIVNSLKTYHLAFNNEFTVIYPSNDQSYSATLLEIVQDISRRIVSIFLPDLTGHRPLHGSCDIYNTDPDWSNLVLFYEYFHGDTGRGCGASHQTGWTALVTEFLYFMAR